MVYRWYFPHVPGIQFYMCFFVSLYIYIYGTPSPRPTFLLPWLLWHLSNLQWRCNAIASWMDSRFKIPRDSFEQILNPNLESNPWIQDSRFLGTLSSKSWIQDSRFKIQDSQGLFAGNLESRIQDGFKICSKEFLGILNLESRGWIQDLLQRVPGNLESWIQWLDSRFAPKSSWEYWILKFRPEK